MKSLLGKENFLLQIISSMILYIISFFFIFWIGSYFEVGIFPLENRSTNSTSFEIYIFEKFIDAVIITSLTTLWFVLSLRSKKRILTVIIYGSITAIAIFTNLISLLDIVVLISIPIIASFFVYHFFTKKIVQIQTKFLMGFFSLLVFCIAISGVIISLISISSIEQPEAIRNHAIDIFLLFSSFSPVLMFLLLTGSFVKLLILNKIQEINFRIKQLQIKSYNIKRKNKFLFIFLFMFLSIFIALLPHQSFVNVGNDLVGADTIGYVKMLEGIQMNDKENFVYSVFVAENFEDRPLSLMLFLPVLAISPENPYHIIDNLPVILSPLLVLTVFFLTREITTNDTIALIASFLTAISFQALIGIYAGLYANWLALIFGYLSFVFLFRFLKRSKGVSYLLFSIFFFLMMLSHNYTWTFFALFIGVFLIVSYRLGMYEKRQIVLIFLIILSLFAFDFGKSVMIDVPNGMERYIMFTSENASFLNLFSIWSNLSHTSLVFVGGLFGNFLILSLCIYWLVRSNLQDKHNLFIAIFLTIGVIPVLFGGELIQSRVLYNIPFQIPAAIAIFYISNLHKGKLLAFSISIWIFVMSIQAAINFI